MARYDGKLQADSEATREELRLLLEGLDPQPGRSPTERQEAVICLLSASEGWRDACRLAGGAFADESPNETGLRSVKGE